MLTLLAKLDSVANGEYSKCTIVKNDNQHKVYPQTMKSIEVCAVEDKDYYIDREPGFVKEDYKIKEIK